MLFAETALTLSSLAPRPPRTGLLATFHDEPFQWSIIGSGTLPALNSKPTAQALHADGIVTPCSSLSAVPGFGGCRPVQF
jgi:hypothetical protein